MAVRLCVEVEVLEGTDVEQLAEQLFDFLASDPDDLFPAITSVCDYDTAVVP